jgi:hypothetical protein
MNTRGVRLLALAFSLLLVGQGHGLLNGTNFVLDYETAEELAKLPLECCDRDYPYKPTIILNGTDDIQVSLLQFPGDALPPGCNLSEILLSVYCWPANNDFIVGQFQIE